LVRSPINLSQFPQSESFDNAAPDPGANSVEVLEQLGFDQLRISKLQEEGVIG
jgi:crotonobetainyl-CoA:carnitine CoA-transferase CaiB-like acyl-CoA transferase